MPLPVLFANATNATGAQLDSDFAVAAQIGAISCTITGTNTLALAPAANMPSIAAYSNYLRFSGIISVTNTGAVTAAVGSLAAVNCYKDTASGPVALVAGDLVLNNAAFFTYDSALNGGLGGFHVVTPTAASAGTVTSVSQGAGIACSPNPITTTGSVALAAITNLFLLSNISGGAAAPSGNSLSAILDAVLGTTRGNMIFRGAASWGALAKQNQFQQLYITSAGDIAWGISKALGLAATGNSQGTALALTATFNEVTSTPAATGVIATLPAVSNSGGYYVVFNRGANTLNFYPPSGGAIDGNGVNTAVTIAAGAVGRYTMVSDVQIYTS